ncbi:MAG: YkgJ family cysteine cluster protein [Bdellovibrionaceae bacterium]|nr:YkgJ family cysteine cluster protein [Pseudobdellovibrionaceae bacterium]
MTETQNSTQWWDNGIQFECQGSGRCCTSHGEFGFVYVNLTDRKRLARFHKLTTSSFTKKYCEKRSGIWHIKERRDNPDCLFLSGKKCGVYLARPTQCRTWPFWPEVMEAKAWKKEVVSFCPGVGHGKIHSAKEIKKTLQEQIDSETELLQGR